MSDLATRKLNLINLITSVDEKQLSLLERLMSLYNQSNVDILEERLADYPDTCYDCYRNGRVLGCADCRK